MDRNFLVTIQAPRCELLGLTNEEEFIQNLEIERAENEKAFTIGFIVNEQTGSLEEQVCTLITMCQIKDIKHEKIERLENDSMTTKLLVFSNNAWTVSKLIDSINITCPTKLVLENTT